MPGLVTWGQGYSVDARELNAPISTPSNMTMTPTNPYLPKRHLLIIDLPVPDSSNTRLWTRGYFITTPR